MRSCTNLKSVVVKGGGTYSVSSKSISSSSCSFRETAFVRSVSGTGTDNASYTNANRREGNYSSNSHPVFPTLTNSSPSMAAWRRSAAQAQQLQNVNHQSHHRNFSSLANKNNSQIAKLFVMDGLKSSCQNGEQVRYKSNRSGTSSPTSAKPSSSASTFDSKLLENTHNSHYFSEGNSTTCSIPISSSLPSSSSRKLGVTDADLLEENCNSNNKNNEDFNVGINNNNNGISTIIQQSSLKLSASSSATVSSQGTPGAKLSTAASYTPIRTVVTSQRLVEVSKDTTMEQPKLMSKEEREEFMSVYHGLVKDLLDIPDMKDMEETNRWMARVLQYNVPHGKRNRGLYTALAYKYLAPEELTEENVRLSHILGWCVEILQAFFLVSDDIMDGSETRRGRPCWYKVDNLGLAAVNDALLLEAVIYQILRKHFTGKPCYTKLMEVMNDVTYKTIFGQSLDTRTGQDRRMETYTMERYTSIVKYKTSYYSFYLPVALAMTLCDIKDPNLFQQVRKVTLEMGHYFQVQDDYLDCFGDVEVTGKIGTDIQDCKCSWLFVIAVQRCNPDQKKFLLENYGVNEPAKIEAVKKLYKDLELEDVYHNYEEQTYNLICTHIQQMDEALPKGLFFDMLHKIYKRSS